MNYYKKLSPEYLNNPPGGYLDRTFDQVRKRLLAGEGVCKIAADLKISRRTISRWRKRLGV